MIQGPGDPKVSILIKRGSALFSPRSHWGANDNSDPAERKKMNYWLLGQQRQMTTMQVLDELRHTGMLRQDEIEACLRGEMSLTRGAIYNHSYYDHPTIKVGDKDKLYPDRALQIEMDLLLDINRL